MKAERYLPVDLLKPYIRAFMILESDAGMTNRILPDTGMTMAFRVRGNVTYTTQGIRNSLPLSVVTGLRKSTRLMEYAQQSATLLVLFREAGAAAFFNTPLHELYDQSVSLDHFAGRETVEEVEEVEERLAAAPHHAARITIVEKLLLSLLRQTPPEPLVAQAIRHIHAMKGTINVEKLSRALFISQDALEKKFRRVTGASPKRFAATIRLRNLISNYSPAQSLTALTYQAGYFDQSHFIKDFRAFTGQAPHDFFKSSRYW